MNVVETWRILDSLYPMPISRSRDRIAGYLYDCKEMGLLTLEEYKTLLNEDAEWREREWKRMQQSNTVDETTHYK